MVYCLVVWLGLPFGFGVFVGFSLRVCELVKTYVVVFAGLL